MMMMMIMIMAVVVSLRLFSVEKLINMDTTYGQHTICIFSLICCFKSLSLSFSDFYFIYFFFHPFFYI